jgi:nucleoside-diphosphate-sugar epimerase/predicted dehydrogenase
VISTHKTHVLLGGGRVTAEYYLPALRRLGLAGRTTVVDPSDPSLAALREEFPDTAFVNQDHRSFIAALAPGGEERVIVALPNHLHVEAAQAALGAGRHVLCEKPLSLKSDACRALRAQARDAGRLLKVAMSRRYLPSLMLARQMVLAEEFGPVESIEVQDCAPFPWRPKSFAFFAPEAGGILADMGVHYLDYLETVVGALEPVSYVDDSRGSNEASLVYALRAGAVPIRMRLSRLDPAGSFLRFSCARAEILVHKERERDVFVTPRKGPVRRVVVEQAFAEPSWPNDFHGSFCAMLADFENAIAGRTHAIADASDAERTAALIAWAYAARDPKDATASRRSQAVPPEVFVTGATGFIGSHLVERLSGQGEAIRAAVRTPASCANIARYPVEMTPVDLLKKEDLAKAVSGIRRVFHLAYGREGPQAAAVTIEGTKNVVEAAIAAGAECVVVLSTMYVFGFPNGPQPVDENFPYRPYGGEYGESKAVMERWCLERAKSSGKTRIVVLNPTCVFGPGGGAYTTLPVTLAARGQFAWVEDGRGTCNFTYVENVIDAMLKAMTVEAAHGQRFIVNDGSMSWRDFLSPLLGPFAKDLPSYSIEHLKALPRFGPPFRLKDLFSAALTAGEIRAVAKRSAVVRSVFASLRDGHTLRPSFAEQMDLRDNLERNRTAVFPPEWLAELYGPAGTIFSARKAQDVLNWSPAIRYEAARDTTMRWLEQAGYYVPSAA